MNNYDKISFKNAYIEDFSFKRVKLPILNEVREMQESGAKVKYRNYDTSTVHGLTMLKINEHGFCSFDITGKFLQEYYFDGINHNTIDKITSRLNEEVFRKKYGNTVYNDAFHIDSLLDTDIGIVDNNVDVEIDDNTILILQSLLYHQDIKVEVFRNGNIVFSCNKKGKEFRLTIYNKAKEFERQTKANEELRNHNVEPPSPNLWRFEVRIPTLNAIRRITGEKRLNTPVKTSDGNKAQLLKPTFYDLLSSTKNGVVQALKQILSNVMIEPNRTMNDRETIVYLAYENRQFQRMRTRAFLIKRYGKSAYEEKYSKILTQIEQECKQLEPNGDTVIDVLKCLKR